MTPTLDHDAAIAAYDRDGPTVAYTPFDLIAGAVVLRDDEGHPVLTAEQVDAVRAETAAIVAAHEARVALPVDDGTPVAQGGVCDTLRDHDVWQSPEDPYRYARTHDTIARRTSSGRSTLEVIGRHRLPAPVTDAPSGLSGLSSAGLAQIADDILRHHRDVGTITPMGNASTPGRYGLIGTEGSTTAWSVLTPPLSPAPCRYMTDAEGEIATAWNGSPMPADETYGYDLDAASAASRHTADLAGWIANVPTEYLTARRADASGANDASDDAADTVLRDAVEVGLAWPRRNALGVRRSRRLDETDVTIAPLVMHDDGTTSGSLTRCVAWHDDSERVWIGHVLHERSATQAERRDRATTTDGREAETDERKAQRKAEIAAIPPALIDAIAYVLASHRPGTIDTPRGTLTFGAVGRTGRVRCTLVTPDGRQQSWQSRIGADVPGLAIASRVMA